MNIKRICWVYEHFGLLSAVRSAMLDIVIILAYLGYLLTLPLQFVWLVCRGLKKS